MMQDWSEFIFSNRPFEEKALNVFYHQYKHNLVYQRFCDAMAYEPPSKKAENNDFEAMLKESFRSNGSDFPLLPVRAFKDAELSTAYDHSSFITQDSTLIFKSSGTGGMEPSTHLLADKAIYSQSVLQGFRHFYDLKHAVILGYTPGYAENLHSSLVWMIRKLMEQDDIKKSRFLPLDMPLSQGEVDDIAASGRQLILFGAAFGLIDLVDNSDATLPSNSIVIETGGMKTHRREMSRSRMHQCLADGFGIHLNRIHSEYGMCELLSQAYATGGKWFRSVPWMQVSVRDPDDTQRRLPPGREGLLGVIDLANVHSCSFLLTGDRGVMDPNGRFQVLGRWQPEDLRGCNFLIDSD